MASATSCNNDSCVNCYYFNCHSFKIAGVSWIVKVSRATYDAMYVQYMGRGSIGVQLLCHVCLSCHIVLLTVLTPETVHKF